MPFRKHKYTDVPDHKVWCSKNNLEIRPQNKTITSFTVFIYGVCFLTSNEGQSL